MSSGRPNIVMVSIDSLRGDHCGYLGDDRGLTPTMDAFAEEGVAFETAIAPGPQTFSSMPAVFTGQQRAPTSLEAYPQDSHWGRRLAAIDEHLRRHRTLPERLRELGYDTAGLTPNPWTSTASGFDRGFDHFSDFSEQDDDSMARRLTEHLPGLADDSRSVSLVLNMLSGREFFAQWETFYDEIQRIRDRLTEPYFLWVFILDTHFPFLPPRRHRQEQSALGAYYSTFRSADRMRGNGGAVSDRILASLGRSYRDTVRAADAFLAQLSSDLGGDDPVFVVHSDHGESFGEHGNFGHHHRQVFEENIHVPYVVYNADVTADVRAPTSLTTLYDTTVSIARTGTFSPADSSDASATSGSECGVNRAVRGPRFKYVESAAEQALYDLETDPDETVDISAERPAVRRRLQARLARRYRHTAEADRIHRATPELAELGRL